MMLFSARVVELRENENDPSQIDVTINRKTALQNSSPQLWSFKKVMRIGSLITLEKEYQPLFRLSVVEWPNMSDSTAENVPDCQGRYSAISFQKRRRCRSQYHHCRGKVSTYKRPPRNEKKNKTGTSQVGGLLKAQKVQSVCNMLEAF